MKVEIKIPAMGESISEVTIGQILANTGTDVKVDSEILELETDKVNQILYAPQTGKVSLQVKSGDVVKIGQTIGFIDVSDRKDSTQKEEKNENDPVEIQKKDPKKSQAEEKPIQEKSSKESKNESKSPLRYTKEDFIEELQPHKEEKGNRVIPPYIEAKRNEVPDRSETRKSMSTIRKVIADRLVQAQQTTAMLTTFNEVDMTGIIEIRERYKESFLKKYGCKLGFMSVFVKAVISALKQFPIVNSYIDGDDIIQRNYYDIGVAVGTDKGVIVPVIRNGDHLSFAEIEQTIEGYALKAREGKIALEELQGGGFTITNGGTYGSLLSTPILIPPQCAILGMHKIEKRPIVIGNEIYIRSMMYLALSYDHRLIDGKEAVTFLVHIKNTLEDPSRLLFEI